MSKYFISILPLILLVLSGCVETVYKTEVRYVRPEIPESIISPCEQITFNGIQTNGDLLMSYISLNSAYSICSAKVNSIRQIIQSYSEIYGIEDYTSSNVNEQNIEEQK
jgi:hypothetical protein